MIDLSTAANSPGAFKNVYDSIISLIELSKALPETAARNIYRKKENSLTSYQHKESAVERTMFRDRVHAVDTVTINNFNAKTGNDLNEVKMVYGPSSDEYTRSRHALAIAVAGTIYFRNGSYKPETGEGQKLLAHELTHVAQFKNREDYRNISKEQKEAEAESNEQNEAHESDPAESRKIDGVEYRLKKSLWKRIDNETKLSLERKIEEAEKAMSDSDFYRLLLNYERWEERTRWEI